MAHKKIPNFSSEQDEQDFWAKHDSTPYLDWKKGQIGIFAQLKPSTKTISLRLPASLLDALRLLANKKDVPYQSLMKLFLAERLKEEMELPNGEPIQRKRAHRGK